MKVDKSKGITFEAIFSKATTTVDKGWNITFSLSEEDSNKVATIAALKDSVLQVAIIPIT